jgi:hypothetical protein
MRYVIAFQQRGQNATSTKRVGFEGDEEENRRRESMVCPYEVLI